VQTVKQTSSTSDKSTRKGGVSFHLLKGDVSAEEAINHTQERLFDATWSLPINLLDKLSELNLIKRGVDGKTLGDIILIEGNMRVFDISFYQKSLPFISQVMLNQAKSESKETKKSNKHINPENIEVADGMTFGMMSKLFEVIPNTLQVDFVDEAQNNIWMTINRENFTINADDIPLKYGNGIPGHWYALGVIDAFPDNDQSNKLGDFPFHPLKDGLTQMLSGIQQLAGRDATSYGMTPLVIFRKIS